jgi:hypothetical protein
MHSSSVSASLRHGITTDNSNGPVSGSREGFRFATVGIFSTPILAWRTRPLLLDEQGVQNEL